MILNVRRLAYSMLAEWRVFRPLYESVLLAVVWAYLGGVSVMIVRSASFRLEGLGWRCVIIGGLALCVWGVADSLLQIRRFVRR